MRVENWESKLNWVVQKTINKDKFEYGKNDCVTFPQQCVEAITGKNIFDHKWKSLKDGKELIKKLKKKDILSAALWVAKNNNFKQIDVSKAQRWDILYHKNIRQSDVEGTLGVCLGDNTMFNWSKGINLKPTLECKLAWRIE